MEYYDSKVAAEGKSLDDLNNKIFGSTRGYAKVEQARADDRTQRDKPFHESTRLCRQ